MRRALAALLCALAIGCDDGPEGPQPETLGPDFVSWWTRRCLRHCTNAAALEKSADECVADCWRTSARIADVARALEADADPAQTFAYSRCVLEMCHGGMSGWTAVACERECRDGAVILSLMGGV